MKKTSTAYKSLEHVDMLKDFDIETEKSAIIQKLTARRDSARTNFQNMRPNKTITSPQYNFYKPSIEAKPVRAPSKKTDTKPKTRAAKNQSNAHNDTRTYSRPGKSTSHVKHHISKDMGLNVVRSKILTDSVNNEPTLGFDISLLKSEQMSLATKTDGIRNNKETFQRDNSVVSISKGVQYENVYRYEGGNVRKHSELDVTSPVVNPMGRFSNATPSRGSDLNNKRQTDVNIFVSKVKRDF